MVLYKILTGMYIYLGLSWMASLIKQLSSSYEEVSSTIEGKTENTERKKSTISDEEQKENGVLNGILNASSNLIDSFFFFSFFVSHFVYGACKN